MVIIMPFSWKEYQSIALYLENMIGNNDNQEQHYFSQEAVFRTAISRLYYAIFNISLEFACNNYNYNPPKENKHNDLINFLSNNYSNDFSRQLKRIRKYRNECDYDKVIYYNIKNEFCLVKYMVNELIKEIENQN